MLKKILQLSGIGFLIGTLVGNMVIALSGYAETGHITAFVPAFAEKIGSEMPAFIIQLLLSGLDGAVCMGATVLYDSERSPLIIPTALHYGIVMLVYIPMSLYLCWITTVRDMLVVMGIMTAVYILIWVIMYSIYKAQVKELNRLQKNYQIVKKAA